MRSTGIEVLPLEVEITLLTCTGVHMGKRDHFVLLFFQCLFQVYLGNGSADISFDLIHLGSIGFEASTFILGQSHRDIFHYSCSPISKAVPKIAGMQNQCVFAGFDQVARHLHAIGRERPKDSDFQTAKNAAETYHIPSECSAARNEERLAVLRV
jgi:hypothetical protein